MTNQAFDYEIVRSRRRSRTTSLSISADGQIKVNAPWWVHDLIIRKFIESKSDWIISKISQLKQRPQTKKNYQEGELHLYFGQSYPLHLIKKTGIASPKLSLENDQFVCIVPAHHIQDKISKEVEKVFLRWYIDHGKQVIAEKVKKYSQITNLSYNRVVIKNVSSIWGSCSSKNNLNFNRKLIMAPHEVVDYVIIHEVCHLRHRNHGHSFWAMVRELDPLYKRHITWLKTNSHLLSI